MTSKQVVILFIVLAALTAGITLFLMTSGHYEDGKQFGTFAGSMLMIYGMFAFYRFNR